MEKSNSWAPGPKTRWAGALVAYTLLVIIWGAWVRISHSGDGCGDTWPLCRGVLIPEAAQNKTWIEYAHRAMSGIYGILIFAVFIWCKRSKREELKAPALATLIFMITEALLGAKLVLFKLVGSNSSLYRAFVMSLHQINSLLLVGATVWLAWSLEKPELRFKDFLKVKWPLLLILVIASTGAWAALASTLFPTFDLAQGLDQDFSPVSPTLVRLRLIHPVLALSIGIALAVKFWRLDTLGGIRLAALFCFAIIFGMMTLFLLSPVWMKLTHLLIAHLVWICVLSYAALRTQNSVGQSV